MSVFRNLSRRLFAGGEQGLLRECSKLLPIARAAAAALAAPAPGPNVAVIRALEQKADDEKFRIANVVTAGAVAPNVLDNMLSLLTNQDNIVNAIYNLARELSRYGVRDEAEDRYIREQVADVAGLVNPALDTLLEMYDQADLAKLRELRRTIERLEEAGDAVKESMLDRVYAEAVTFQSFYHTVQVAYLADAILDGCEDSADTLLTIVSAIIT